MDKQLLSALSKEKKEEKKEEMVSSTLTFFSNLSLASSLALTSKKLPKIVEVEEKSAEKGLQEAILWLTGNLF